jgi:hypothetical protein
VAETSVGNGAAERLGDGILTAQLTKGSGAVSAVDRVLFCHASPFAYHLIAIKSRQ